MDTYAFVLGRQPELSAAEILACLESGSRYGPDWRFLSVSAEFTLLDLRSDLDTIGLFRQLGGSIKLVEVLERTEAEIDPPSLALRIADHLLSKKEPAGRLMFGLSVYGASKPRDLPQLPQVVKKRLSERGVNSRYIEPFSKAGFALSSAQVLKTGLLEDGFEVVVLLSEACTYIGRTVQVQQFEEIAHRDFGKPERRIDPGLLPPKLARLLINLAGASPGSRLLDPFCGSGVLLAEGALMGYRMTGLDHSEDALSASRTNLTWLDKEYPGLPACEVHRGEAERAVRQFGPFAFDAVVGEGDLGPILSRFVTKKGSTGLVKRYKSFYTTVLAELRSVVRPGGGVVLVVPRWMLRTGESVGLHLSPLIRLMGYREQALFERCGEKIPEAWRNRPLVYCREGQKTAREILCLRA